MNDSLYGAATLMLRKGIVEIMNAKPSFVRQLLEVLRNFGGSEEARCQFAAGLLLRCWQLACGNGPAPAPSFMMVYAPEADSLLLPLLEATCSVPATSHPEDNEAIDPRLHTDNYIRRLDPHRGCMALRYHKTLIVRTSADLKAMRGDLESTAVAFARPLGYYNKQWNHQNCYVAGECSQEEMDEQMVGRVVEGGFPLLFLPYGKFTGTPWMIEATTEQERVEPTWQYALGYLVDGDLRTPEPTRMPRREMFHPDPAEIVFMEYLQTKMARLPPAYAFIVWEAILSLKFVVQPAFNWLHHSSVTPKQQAYVQCEYLWRAISGIAQGVDCLGYFCYGNYAMKERKLPMDLLRYIREQGGCRKQDLSRKFKKVNKEQRDEVLQGLASRSLIVLDDVRVQPVSKEIYLESIRSAPGFPQLRGVGEWPPTPPLKKTKG